MRLAFLYVYEAKLSVLWFQTHLLEISIPCALFSVIITLHTSLYLGNSKAFTLLLISAVSSVVSRRPFSVEYSTVFSLLSSVSFNSDSTLFIAKYFPSSGSSLYVFSKRGCGLLFWLCCWRERLLCANRCQARVATTRRKKFIRGGFPCFCPSDLMEAWSPLGWLRLDVTETLEPWNEIKIYKNIITVLY